MNLRNKYYLLRHGQAISNIEGLCSSWPEKFENPLTEKGAELVKKSAKEIKNKKIDLIFSSDLLRTKQTAEIMAQELKLKPQFDKRLRELDFGIFNGKIKADFDSYFEKEEERLKKSAPEGENYEEVAERVMDFLKEIDGKYENKSILIVSHECPLWILKAKVDGVSLLSILQRTSYKEKLPNGQIKELN